jgi:hypothetical protein
MVNKELLIDYNDIAFETETLKLELEGLSDDVLIDECNYILSSGYESDIMDDILVSYFKKGKISPEDRKKAEGLYTLANGSMTWEV